MMDVEGWISWLRRKKAPTTIYVYTAYMRKYIDFCEARRLDPERVESVDEWVGHMQKKGLTPATINTQFYAVASYFTYIGRGQEVLRVVRPSVKQRRIEIYQLDEAWKLIVLSGPKTYIKAILTLLLINGLRLGEALTLHIDDILQPNWSRPPSEWEPYTIEGTPCIYVTREKVREGIDFGLEPTQEEVIEAVRNTLRAREDLQGGAWRELKRSVNLPKEDRPHRWYLFYSPHSPRGYYDPSGVRKHLGRLCRILGIPYRSPHKLRHTRATHIIAETGDLAAAQQFLRHRSIATTMRYVHLAPQLLIKKIPKVERPEASGSEEKDINSGEEKEE